jgi:hypothetical protein
MHATRRYVSHQQKCIKSQCANSDSYRFFNLLTSDALLDKVETLLPEHRERLYPPTETLSMFLAQTMSADSSCQNIVNQTAIQRLSGGLSPCSTHTGAYCRARQRLPVEMLSSLAQHLGALVDKHTPEQWRWNGRRVRIVDGTTVTMPDTPANQSSYPQQRGQKAGLGFPICRVVGITCLSSGALQNAAIGRFNGKGGDEQTLLRVIEGTFEPGDIVMGDAFFATYFFIAAMQAKGVDILMEQHGARKRVTDFRRGQKLGPRDHLMVIEKPTTKPYWMSEEHYQSAPDSLIVRELKVAGKVLVTTMIDPKSVHKNDLSKLYKSRWAVELDIRDIKDTLGMNILSCKTPAMAVKEIWVYLLAYNLIRLIMAQAALLTGITPREISFKHSLQCWLLGMQQTVMLDDEQLYALCLLIAQQRVGNRPGRIEPRAVKRRPKAYPLLVKPRQAIQQDVRKYGHPKKLK